MAAWFLVMVGAGWYLYQRFQHPEVPQVPWIEKRSTVLITSLERYHDQKGVYPKFLRDLGEPPSKYRLNFIYSGVDRVSVLSDECVETPLADACWKGYRGYGLLVAFSGKTFVYSSAAHGWQEQQS